MGRAQAQTTTNLAVLQGLIPFSTLGNSELGRRALTDNYHITKAIQSGVDGQPLLMSFADQQQQAMQDATITWPNGYELADGLGSSLGDAYQSLTSYDKDGNFTGISDAVNALIQYTVGIAESDAGSAKYFFANETTDGIGSQTVSDVAKAYMTAVNGTTDVYGKAYDLPAGAPGADPNGDSRPFQTDPSYLVYNGTTYFGESASNTEVNAGLADEPSFPSGHTTYAYTESLLFAIMVPERYQQMITRAAEFSNDRIIISAHYAMDVLAARTLALYDVAQLLAGNPDYLGLTEPGLAASESAVKIDNYGAVLDEATSDMRSALANACGASVATCAADDTSRFSSAAADEAFYESTQTYGLPVVYESTANGTEDVYSMARNAGLLLQTRFPYLDLEQLDAILTSTEGAGGGFLDNGSEFGVYSRLDLYKAAGGYGSFAQTVEVTLDGSKDGFLAADTWSNDIGGPGGLVLNGSGTLTLSGADTYTGATVINGGDLVVQGSIVSPVTVGYGGALSGTGTVGGAVTVNAGGTLMPGDAAPGTLTVNAPVTLAAGSFSQFDLEGTGTGTGMGNYSRLIVNGSYAAGGTLTPRLYHNDSDPAQDYRPALGTQFQLVYASGGVQGSYAALDEPQTLAAGTRMDVIYAPDAVTLAVTPTSYASLGEGVTETAHEAAVGAALDAARPAPGSSADATLYAPLYSANNAAAITRTLDQLAPDAYGTSLLAARSAFGLVNGAVETALDARHGGVAPTAQTAPVGERGAIWVTGLGQVGTVGSRSGNPGYDTNLAGVAAGADGAVAPGLRLGAAFGYVHQNVSLDNASSANGDTLHGLVYGSYTRGRLFVDALGGVVALEGNASRSVQGYGTKTGANYSGVGGGGAVRVGAVLPAGRFLLEPSLGLQGAQLQRGAANESGVSGAAVDVESQSLGTLQSLAGVRAARHFTAGATMLTPSVNVGWAHEFLADSATTTARFAATDAAFSTETAAFGRDAALVGARLDVATGSRLKLFVSYEGGFSNNGTANAFNGGLKVAF